MQMSASVGDFFSAVINGAPTPESAERYTAQVTAVISLYICFIAIFLVGLYVRAVGRRVEAQPARKTFKIWIAWSLIFSILMVAAYVGGFLLSIG